MTDREKRDAVLVASYTELSSEIGKLYDEPKATSGVELSLLCLCIVGLMISNFGPRDMEEKNTEVKRFTDYGTWELYTRAGLQKGDDDLEEYGRLFDAFNQRCEVYVPLLDDFIKRPGIETAILIFADADARIAPGWHRSSFIMGSSLAVLHAAARSCLIRISECYGTK